jgi:hypothetical protein
MLLQQGNLHSLKIWPEFFKTLLEGRGAEVRQNDRDYKVGDVIEFNEFDPAEEKATGRQEYRRIVHVARDFPECLVFTGVVVLTMQTIYGPVPGIAEHSSPGA